MFTVGLTGGIGSGKSTIAARFRDLGIVTVDADEVARQVVEPGTDALARIAAHFGPAVLLPDGHLDRAALRERVFAEARERQWLEALLHPLIRQEILRQLREASSPYAILVSPLLVESGQNRLVDRVLVIQVPPEVQVERTMQRDGNSRQQVARIMAAQMSAEDRLAAADDVIDNSGPADSVVGQVERLHRKYLSLAGAQDKD